MALIFAFHSSCVINWPLLPRGRIATQRRGNHWQGAGEGKHWLPVCPPCRGSAPPVAGFSWSHFTGTELCPIMEGLPLNPCRRQPHFLREAETGAFTPPGTQFWLLIQSVCYFSVWFSTTQQSLLYEGTFDIWHLLKQYEVWGPCDSGNMEMALNDRRNQNM